MHARCFTAAAQVSHIIHTGSQSGGIVPHARACGTPKVWRVQGAEGELTRRSCRQLMTAPLSMESGWSKLYAACSTARFP